jgi:hypothetical protein
MENGPLETVFPGPVRDTPERDLRFDDRMRQDIPTPYWRGIKRPPGLLGYFRVIKRQGLAV